jgi:hypothetical protein
MVQSMALPHGEKVEIACNLLDLDVSSCADVQRVTVEMVHSINAVEYLGDDASVSVAGGYVTNQTAESIIAAVDAL